MLTFVSLGSLGAAHEIASDAGIADKLPFVLDLLAPFAPTAFTLFAAAILVGLLFALTAKRVSYMAILWHVAIVVAAIISLCSMALPYGLYIHLDGPRPVTPDRIVGNTILLASLVGLCVLARFRRAPPGDPSRQR